MRGVSFVALAAGHLTLAFIHYAVFRLDRAVRPFVDADLLVHLERPADGPGARPRLLMRVKLIAPALPPMS